MSKELKVQAYCERCKKTEQISVDLSDPEIQNQLMGHSGIFPVSLTHSDHSTIIFIDANGAARRVNYIDLANQRLESAVSSQASIIMEMAIAKKQKFTIFFFSTSPKFRNFLIALGEVLNQNVPETVPFSLVSKENRIIIKISDFTIYYGSMDNFALNHHSKNNLVFVDITAGIPSLKKIKGNKTLYVFYNLQQLIREGKQNNLNDVILKFKPEHLYDFRTSEDIAEAVFRALEGFSA
ncbi:MAG: hypothetical protein D6732_19190 [Methanobacteriota archaeon]|nr:MAG: hypothetical protein D6732_19190 [Euryarchaeota archaeon]